MPETFNNRVAGYTHRVDRRLDAALPEAGLLPARLHEAMRYAVFNGGKRVRPLLVYAAGECVGVSPERLDGPAAAIELIHAFSLVHDDLPAMDDDDLRRGKPTVHVRFDEATAILAADALVPLAFAVMTDVEGVPDAVRVRLVRRLAGACGSTGMTGGQSIDLDAEGQALKPAALERMYAMKTGALIHAAVMAPADIVDTLDTDQRDGLERFARAIGVAFQVRDDLLDVEGETEVIGKQSGADAKLGKATYPSLFGVEASRRRLEALLEDGMAGLARFGERAAALAWLARYIASRGS